MTHEAQPTLDVDDIGRATTSREDSRPVAPLAETASLHDTIDRLKAVEHRLKMALANGGIGTWYYDSDTKHFTEVSDACRAHFGLTDFGPHTLDDLYHRIHVHDKERVKGAIAAIRSSNHDFEVEYRCVWANGVERWTSVRGARALDSGGRLVGMTGTSLDITRSVRRQEAIRKSEQFALSAIDALSAQIAVLDENGVILLTNETWKQFAALETSDIKGMFEGANLLTACAMAAAVNPGEARLTAGVVRDVAQGRLRVWSGEQIVDSPTGPCRLNVEVTRLPGRGHSRIAVSREDIARRSAAAQATRESERSA